MSHDELIYKERVLRECFEEKLSRLDVEGKVPVEEVKCVKTFGALWHYAHELLKVHEHGEEQHGTMTADTMEIKASGLKNIK